MRSGADSNRSGGCLWQRTAFPDNRAAPARDSKPARIRTRTCEVGARRASSYTTSLYRRTTRLERASPGWRPGALPTELHPRESTPGWNRTSVLCRRRAALCPLSYERKEPPAGVEPAPRPYKGRVLAVDTTEARGKSTSWSAFEPSYEATGTHSVRGSSFFGLRASVRIAVQVRPYMSKCSPRLTLRSRVVS